jgi:predicted metal-binding protein
MAKKVDEVVADVAEDVVVAKKPKFKCDNCEDSGRDCSVCTPVFVDTFGVK